ncbi:MAG: DedA family protein [Gemmatimonadetes bacterium]|nr:DedA family protein [Gemmatimonadota bacterium]
MLAWIAEIVTQYGLWLVVAMTFSETALIVGLVVPAEPTIIVAMAFALQGSFPLWALTAATVVGALLGDSVGFWIGRTGRRRLLRGPDRLERAGRKQAGRARALLKKHPGLAISMSRLVPFVRTLMPLVAGSTKITYGRFLLFDVLGVIGWGVGVLGTAYIANVGWGWASRRFGVGIAVVLVLGLLLLGWELRRRLAQRAVPDPEALAP